MFHIRVDHFEIEYVHIFFYPENIRTLGYHSDAFLDQVSQQNLARCPVVFKSQVLYQRVSQEIRGVRDPVRRRNASWF